MNDTNTLPDPEAAIEALFNDFKQTSFPEGWESAILDAATAATVIRISPTEPSTPTLPAPIRIHAPAPFWTRHSLTAARIAAVVALFAGSATLLSLLPDESEIETGAEPSRLTTDVDVSAEVILAPTSLIEPTGGSSIGTPTTGTPTITTPPTTPAPIIEPTTVATSPLATVSVSTTQAPTTARPTTAAPTTAVPTTTAPTTAAPTTAAPTTTAPTTTAPTTTEPPTTTTPPVAVDVAIRDLSVGKITATSAVVSFRTNDCAGARYQVNGSVGTWAAGYPNDRQCWSNHSAVLGTAPFSSKPLESDKKYTVRITTFAADGTTASARVSFRTEDDDTEDDDD